jgi:DNA-binding LytR/AlgR family response regulator
MKGILSKLSESEFIRVHRSFIIPIQKIESVRNKTVHLKGDGKIPIGSSYEEDFLKVFKN